MRAVLLCSPTLLVVPTLRRSVREISNAFQAPFFSTAHYQTHSVPASLRLFPRVVRRLTLEEAPLCRIPVNANLVHPAPSCAYFDTSTLEDVSIEMIARRICPNCAALCGSSSALESLMNPPQGVVLTPFLYAFFTAQLFAHSYRPASTNPHAFGWLLLAADDAARRDPELATLLEPVMEHLSPLRQAVFRRVMPLYHGDDMTPSTIIAPLSHILGSVLGLVPSAFIADDLVVLPDGPKALSQKFQHTHNSVIPMYQMYSYHATPLVPPYAMELFLRLVRTGLEPEGAALAACSLTAELPA
jgi:hypothetical protein